MRLHRLRFDIWLCLLVAYLVSLGTGPQPPPSARPRMTAMQRFTPLLLARRAVLPGQRFPGHRASRSCWSWILSQCSPKVLPTATRERAILRAATSIIWPSPPGNGWLPASILRAYRMERSSHPGRLSSRWARVIWADLEEDPAFLEQITSGYPLDRTDFYVDMAGEAVRYSQEERTENHVIVVQLVTVLVCFPLLHALGSRSGIFPRFLSHRAEGKGGAELTRPAGNLFPVPSSK